MDDKILTSMARAGIKVLFDDLESPTQDMIAAAVERGQQNGYTDVVGIWKAMIAVARKEALGE